MRIPIHNISLWISIHALLLFAIRPVHTILRDGSTITGQIKHDVYILSWFFCVICITCFFLLYFRIKIQPINFSGYHRKIGFLRFFSIFLVWLLAWIFLARDRLDEGLLVLLFTPSYEYIHGSSTFLLNTMTMLVSFFVITSYFIKCSSFVALLTRIGLIIFGILAGVVTGSKTLSLYPIFILLLVHSIRNNGISLKIFSLALVAVVPVIVRIDEIRHYGLHVATDFTSNTFSFVSIFDALVDRFYGVDVVYAIVIAHIEQGKQYYFGESLLAFFYGFIPREFWENKPIISFGKIVAEEYLPYEFQGTGISAAPTVFGELFANFSFASFILIPVIAILFALHLRRVLGRVASNSFHFLTYYLISFTTLAFFLEVSIVGWLLQLIALYFGTYLLSLGCGLSMSGGKNLVKHVAH